LYWLFYRQRNIRSSFSNLLIEHVKQTSNVSTHHLSKFVLSFEDTIWIEDCPYCCFLCCNWYGCL